MRHLDIIIMFFGNQNVTQPDEKKTGQLSQRGRLLQFDEQALSYDSNELFQQKSLSSGLEDLLRHARSPNQGFWSGEQKSTASWMTQNYSSADSSPVKSDFWSVGERHSNKPDRTKQEGRRFTLIPEGHTSKSTNTLNETDSSENLVLKTHQDPATSEYPYVHHQHMAELLQSHIDPNNYLTSSKRSADNYRDDCDSEMAHLMSKPYLQNKNRFENTDSESIQHKKIQCELSNQRTRVRSKAKTQGKIQRLPSFSEEITDELFHTSQDTNCEPSFMGSPLNAECFASQTADGSAFKLLVIDCRYHYEYQGSHLKSAINISSPLALTHLFTTLRHLLFEDAFLDLLLSLEGKEITLEDLEKISAESKQLSEAKKKLANFKSSNHLNTHLSLEDAFKAGNPKDLGRVMPVIVLHCEFSSKRGPKFFSRIRGLDRSLNQYPALSFPQLYVLKGGFEGFFKSHPHLCVGEDTYRPMALEGYQDELHKYESQIAFEWRQLKISKALCLGSI